RCDADVLCEWHFPSAATALRGVVRARMIHQDSPHDTGGDREELSPVLPPNAPEIDEAQIGFVYEPGGSQRVIRPLGRQPPPRPPAAAAQPAGGLHTRQPSGDRRRRHRLCPTPAATPSHHPGTCTRTRLADCRVHLASCNSRAQAPINAKGAAEKP